MANFEIKAAHSEAPLSRYNPNGFHHLAEKINTLSCRGGHFLEGDVADFDAPLFNITAQEAKAMDPTARMLLEVTYEAFENAGIPIESLVGSQTSYYVGCFTRDYHEMLTRDAETSPMYAGTGLTRLLVELGARNIVFLSRSGAKTVEAQKLLQELAGSDVVAKSYACDISDENALKDTILQCSTEMPPIKGIIQSAAVLNDSAYENMTHELWQGAIRPKIQGTQNLNDLLPKDMDFFVMLSSISGVVGNRSQANYAAGNTFQDALAQHGRKQGLPAVSIDLGLMLGIGLIAQRGGSTNLRKSETVGLYEDDFHAIVKAAISGSYGLAETPAQLITGLPTGGILRSGGLEDPFYYNDPRFSILKKTGLDKVTGNENGERGASSGESDAIAQLSHCFNLHDASRLIRIALCARLAKALETVPENIDSRKPLHTHGVDSLMAVDFRTWILTQIKAEISLFDILSGGSIETLAEKLATTSKLVPVGIDRRGSLDDRRGSLSSS